MHLPRLLQQIILGLLQLILQLSGPPLDVLITPGQIIMDVRQEEFMSYFSLEAMILFLSSSSALTPAATDRTSPSFNSGENCSRLTDSIALRL